MRPSRARRSLAVGQTHAVVRARSKRSRPSALARSRSDKERAASLRRRALLVLACAFALLCLVGLWRSPAISVRRVEVTGLAPLTPPEAQATIQAATVPPHTSLTHAPVREVEARLKRLPWVANARAYRRMPPRLIVRITPRLPVAVLCVGPDRWEMDADGVLVRPSVSAKGLPEIVSPGGFGLAAGRPVVDATVLATLRIVAPEPGARPLAVAKIEVDPHGELCLNMKDTVAIRLGQVDDLSTKLALARRIYEEEPRIAERVELIDLRCPEALACIPRAATKPTPREAAARPASTRSTGSADTPVRAPGTRPDRTGGGAGL